jgi:hypothetical protein
MPKIKAIATSNEHAAKLRGTKASAGTNNIADKTHLLISFCLSGANIAPNVAANIIDALIQHTNPIVIIIWRNISKYIIYFKEINYPS